MDVVELLEELTQVWAATFVAEDWATEAEMMSQESAAFLASAHEQASEVAQKVSLLEGELVAMHQARDTSKAKLPGLIDRQPMPTGDGTRPRGSARPYMRSLLYCGLGGHSCT